MTLAYVIAALLTVTVFSRIFGDNPLFRVAQYVFVGVSLGLAFVVAYQEVLRPAVVAVVADPLGSAGLLYLVPLALGLLLLPRITRRQGFSWLANIPLAIIFGVGAALAAGGALAGTLIPQVGLAARPVGDLAQIIGAVVLAVATIAVLCSFYFTVQGDNRLGRLVRGSATIGHWVLMLAFGFFFAGAVQTYMAALTERLRFLVDPFL
ncbi:MAG: hypothetical protein H7Z42_07055 [Roseiflexaceae bacterium]|nr:hypothetical protein [Roseiflexaceae bacterium]